MRPCTIARSVKLAVYQASHAVTSIWIALLPSISRFISASATDVNAVAPGGKSVASEWPPVPTDNSVLLCRQALAAFAEPSATGLERPISTVAKRAKMGLLKARRVRPALGIKAFGS